MTTTSSPEGKKQALIIIKWVARIFLFLLGLVGFSQSFLAGTFFILAGAAIIPIVSEWLKTKFPIWGNKPVRIIVPIIFCLIGIVMVGANTSEEATNNPESKEQKSGKANKEQKSPYQSYLDGFKTVELTDEAKKNRELHLSDFEQEEYYKILVDSAIVSGKYIPIMQAIAEGVMYSGADGIAMTGKTQEKVKLSGDNAMYFTEVAMIVGMPKFGGYTKELIDVFERYRKEYGYYRDEATSYRDKNGEWQTIEPFDFSPIFAVLDPKNPKVLDALYEARKKGVSSWSKCDGCFYPYITSKPDYIEYIKQVYPKSKYIPKWEIEISARALYAAYNANEVAADNQYKSKLIAVTGTIDNIGKDILGDPYISLIAGEYLQRVNCYFSEKDNNVIAQLKKNQKITIVGKCGGFSLMSVVIKNCEIWED